MAYPSAKPFGHQFSGHGIQDFVNKKSVTVTPR